MSDKVGRDNSVFGIGDDALVGSFGSVFESSRDFFVGSTLVETDNKVDHRHVARGDTEGQTAALSLAENSRDQQTTYVSLPFKSGMTFPTALAAPVEDGMMLLLTPRPPRQSLFEGPSTVF